MTTVEKGPQGPTEEMISAGKGQGPSASPGVLAPAPGTVGEQDKDAEFAQEMAKESIVTLVGMVPYVGPVLGLYASAMMKLFWPSEGPDVWADIRDRVEKAIRESLENFWVKLVGYDLDDCKGKVQYYVKMAKIANSGNAEDKRLARAAYFDAKFFLESKYRRFTDDDFGWKALHVFAQYANLHILLLRDIIANASYLDLESDDLDKAKKTLAKVAAKTEKSGGTWSGGTYASYVMNTYEKGVRICFNDKDWPQVFDYQRVMHTGAIDYAQRLWPLLADPGTQPKEVERDYYLWQGPFGTTIGGSGADFRKWVYAEHSDGTPHWMYPLHKPNLYEKWGIYTAHVSDYRRPSGFQGKYPNSEEWDWTQGTRGDRWHELYPAGKTGRPHKLWVHAVSHLYVTCLCVGWRDKTDSGWYGTVMADENQRVDRYQMTGWSIAAFRVDSRYWTGHMNALMVGFRPDNPKWIPKEKLPPVPGEHYNLVSPETGQALDLARLSFADGVPAAVAAPGDGLSQQWRLVPAETAGHDGGEAWRLINRYSHRALTTSDGRAVQRDLDGGGTVWTLLPNGDHTFRLESDGVGIDTLLGEDALPNRWLLYPSTDTPPTATGGTRTRRVRAVPDTVDGRNAIRVTISSPPAAPPIDTWELSLNLPAEAGDTITLATAPARWHSDSLVTDARLATADHDGRGTNITITPGSRPGRLGEGETLTLILLTSTTAQDIDPAALMPDDIRLNGEPLAHA
ncbi:insecticidal delta-endotoxin Cry8Ea1 family protein [Streptomyces sp. SP18CS02]|uniref:insecticidal delta-endotoxin Cry8Ea1 family protein n=1 Tax=Streptomyces sp. SP18CS02 TaxID=3002531 RepID=UPI002E7926AF|nr:insecticidal delta-endotoxin Cry8Ea1 family protein [Streptomyces sp. SP18CS02]MEE1751152.1 insecticidal delta-endotoxin Cry8Ea1 family protein [Streptomyces sp. SP18CS02]